MNTLTPKCRIAGIAVALVIVQHALHVSSLDLIDNMPQPIWLVANLLQAIVLFAAARMLVEKHKTIATLTGIIGACLVVSVVLENFVVADTLGTPYWMPMSSLLIFGLILSAIYLVKD